MVAVTFCPPHAALGADAPEVIQLKSRQAVSATFDSHGEAVSTGIAFSDYDRMATYKRGGSSGLKKVPTWINSPETFREVVTRMVENRAFFQRTYSLYGTHKDRISRAQLALNGQRDKLIAICDRLCEEYVQKLNAGADRTDLLGLAKKIEEKDSQIAHIAQNAALVTSILFLSYRVGMNSTEVAAELKCVKPPLVRQIGHRARQIGDEIIGGKIHAEKWKRRAARAAASRAARAAAARDKGEKQNG
jgi:hypothetical protein